MKTIRVLLRWVAALLVLAAPAWVHAQSCTAIAGSASVTVTDVIPTATTNYDVQGSVTFNCTRPSGNPRFPSTFWIGTSGTNGSRNLANGANNLAYSLFTNYSGCSTAWSGTTGLTVANALTANTDVTLTGVSAPFCMRISTSGQNAAKPLTFTVTESLSVKSTNSTGLQWGTGSVSLTGTVNPLCKFSSPGTTTLAMTYTSFQTSASTNNTTFNMKCTNTTSFSLSLDAITGTVAALNLNYDIGLGAVGTQTIASQSGTGSNQPYGVYGSVPANQSGTCATGAGCSSSSTRTLTISY